MMRMKRLSLIILIFIAVLAVIVGPIAVQGSKIRPFILPFGNLSGPNTGYLGQSYDNRVLDLLSLLIPAS